MSHKIQLLMIVLKCTDVDMFDICGYFVGLSRAVDSWLPSRGVWTFRPIETHNICSIWVLNDHTSLILKTFEPDAKYLIWFLQRYLEIIGIPDMNFWSYRTLFSKLIKKIFNHSRTTRKESIPSTINLVSPSHDTRPSMKCAKVN